MRIIAGTKRGMKLAGPKTLDSRPYTDRTKESLFSVLYKYGTTEGKIVADIFCGVGSMGLEALSRGAKKVTFIEKNPKIINILKKNIEKSGFVAESKVIRANAFQIGAVVEDDKYDMVFIDPPYALTGDVSTGSLLGRLLELIQCQLADDAIAIVRTHIHSELLEWYGTLKVKERRKWGNMAVTILGQDVDDEQTGCSKDN